MNHDIDVKKTRINCFRQSKVPGEFMLQLRVPGALIDAKHLSLVQELCEYLQDGLRPGALYWMRRLRKGL